MKTKFWWPMLFMACMICVSAFSQSQKHPVIYATEEERPRILELIDRQDWAKSIVTQFRSNVDPKLNIHQVNPDVITNNLPDFPSSDDNTEAEASPLAAAHSKVLTTASYSAMLYYITQEEKYASFAGDILTYYIDLLEPKTAKNATISGNHFYDPRTVFGPFAITYDFIYNYLKKPGTTVYNKSTKKRELFSNAEAQKALRNIVGNTLNEEEGYETNGRFISNHHILTGPGSLFPILCIEDDKEREYFFNIFWEKGTKRQSSFKNTILLMFGEQGIWPESTSYGFMPNVSMILNVVDRVKPEMNIYDETKNIFEGMFLFENLRNPNRSFVRYGDSKRNLDTTDENYRLALAFAKRRKNLELQTKAEIALRQFYDASGGYKPVLSSGTFDNYDALELFWGEELPSISVNEFDYKPTVIVKHAGVALQRNHVEKQNSIYGLCGIIGGAHYVHSHATGIAMELYGMEYVMAPNGGLPPSLPERRIPEHRHYFMRHGGNNTVVVNGTSQGRQEGSWASGIKIWQNTTVNVAAEPGHLEDPINKNFSFATQFLKDEVNNCEQQRTLGIIRTSETSAYYFDMFRSKSLGENNFHDYIYHNIGDETLITNSKKEVLGVSNTNRYSGDIGDSVKSPGWSLLENTQVTEPTAEGVKIRFKINFNNRYMHMFIPAGANKEYTKALGPASREAENGYLTKKTQVVAIRQNGEAWNRPFISVFEPSLKEESSVQSVEPLVFNGASVGAIVTNNVAGNIVSDYIICNDTDDREVDFPDFQLKFKGRFAIVRKEFLNDKKVITLYIGEGSNLTFESYSLQSDLQNKGVASFDDLVLGTGITENEKLEVYPNPSKDVLIVKTKDPDWKMLKIFNSKGNEVYSNESGNTSLEVSIETYKMIPGIYVLELIDHRNARITRKIAIE
ncbi:Por secretion system C-terminal sorting domain-containing protein [Spirosomataceae bacterium TFI 002]|nr:Por secretion system C-terminal sorting domain-containing protein [Spirosomataceae bacterium TFI 002]